MHTDLLAQRVKDRRIALGLSQEDVAGKGGPSTTTMTKIEAGTISGLRRRTMTDLDHVLGWRVGSTEWLLYEAQEPKVITNPRGERPRTRVAPEVPGPMFPTDPDPDEREAWYVSRATRDVEGRDVVVGSVASIDAEGVRSIVEVRYWPGAENRVVSMSSFPMAVSEAHRLALEATSIYRPAKETQDEPRDPAPITPAGGSPAPEDDDVSEDGYMLAARDDDDDDEAEAQQVDP